MKVTDRFAVRMAGKVALFCLLVGAGAELQAAEPFSYPQPGKQLVFPRDHGSHPDFKIEWWYITGHLWSRADEGRRFGFQATFFRSAGAQPGDPNAEPKATFGAEPIYLAHMALLDVKTGKFISQERLNRSGWDASSSVETLDVRNGSWSLRFTDAVAERMELSGSVRSDALFSLMLTPSRPLVRFGREGVSRKGADPLASSYYLTFPRLATEGTLRLGNEELAVHGEAWMDHEISSSQLTGESGGMGLGRRSSSAMDARSWRTACGWRMADGSVLHARLGRGRGRAAACGTRTVHVEAAQNLEKPAHGGGVSERSRNQNARSENRGHDSPCGWCRWRSTRSLRADSVAWRIGKGRAVSSTSAMKKSVRRFWS